MWLRWWTLVVWAGVAGSALFWGMKLATRAEPVPPQAQVAEPGVGLRGDLARLLGAEPPPAAEAGPVAAADTRFALLGVVHPRAESAAREGVALIAVDGKPARAYRVGAVIEGSHVLKSVNARGVTLQAREGEALVSLDIPPPQPAATGVLPAATSGQAARTPTPTVAVPAAVPQVPAVPHAPAAAAPAAPAVPAPGEPPSRRRMRFSAGTPPAEEGDASSK